MGPSPASWLDRRITADAGRLGVTVPAGAVERRLAGVLGSVGERWRGVDERRPRVQPLHLRELVLVTAAAEGDAAGTERLVAEIGPWVERILRFRARRLGSTPDELRGPVYEHLLTPGRDAAVRIAGYEGRSTLRRYVEVTVHALLVRRHRARRRAESRSTPVDAADAAIESQLRTEPRPLESHFGRRAVAALEEALREGLLRSRPLDRARVRKEFVGGRRPVQIAREEGVAAPAIARSKARVLDNVRVELERRGLTEGGAVEGLVDCAERHLAGVLQRMFDELDDPRTTDGSSRSATGGRAAAREGER